MTAAPEKREKFGLIGESADKKERQPIGRLQGSRDYFFFFAALGARGAFTAGMASGRGVKEPGSAGCRVVKKDEEIFLLLPSLN